MTSREFKLANQILIAFNEGDTENANQLLNHLTNSLDENHKAKIVNIVQRKYTFNHEEKAESAKDLYSEACIVFLQNIKKDINLLNGLKYENYMLGICRNLYLEKSRKASAKGYQDAYQFENQLSIPDVEESPFESDEIQREVEDALINYYESKQMIECLKILYYSWKKDYKNHEIAAMMNLDLTSKAEASRRVSVIQQNCIKKAWRNIGLLHDIKKKYNIKKRNKIYWSRNAGDK